MAPITALGSPACAVAVALTSQLPNPISAPARVLDILLQAYAISVVAVLAGSWGAFFHRRSMERAPMHPHDHPAG